MEHVIYRWDLDKTYLKTEFDTFKDIIKIAFEQAEEKQSVPGAPSLLKELQKNENNQIYFISGSPKQMRKVLEKKLTIDGIRWEQLVLKPNLQNLLLGRFHAMREQIGFKLPMLLEDRVKGRKELKEVLFGDDAESDAYIYSLYADTIAGEVKEETIQKVTELVHAPHANIKKISVLLDHIHHTDSVEKIFIYLEKKSPPKRFEVYGSRLVSIYNYFQAALVLYTEGLMVLASIIRLILDLIFEYKYSPEILANSLQDLMRRGILNMEQSARIVEGIKHNLNVKVIPLPDGFYERLVGLFDTLREAGEESLEKQEPEALDYVKLYNKEHEKFIRQKRSMIDRILWFDK